jgi:predicted TIM-barrel enzyme
MLIGHSITYKDLAFVYDVVRARFPSLWIGVNFLDLSDESDGGTLAGVVQNLFGLNALWMDTIPYKKMRLPDGVRFYGGVAFKYRNADITGDALKKSCDHAMACADVVVTSGIKTGVPPSVSKLRDMHTFVTTRVPLAVASGVSVENVSEMLPFVDEFFVATSILAQRTNSGAADFLDPQKVKALADAIHVEC